MLFPKQEEAFFKIGDNMEEELTFEVLYEAYRLCLKNKKKKYGTYNFTNEELCQNLLKTLDEQRGWSICSKFRTRGTHLAIKNIA